ncbi:MAG TPA: hypothetical protein DCR40_14290 [Prolixibacteraceae bacterium]|nr:hypothetical protein [Prolixibacteraceae bacterium]
MYYITAFGTENGKKLNNLHSLLFSYKLHVKSREKKAQKNLGAWRVPEFFFRFFNGRCVFFFGNFLL